MPATTGSGLRPHKDDYEFLCPCKQCRATGWEVLIEGQSDDFPWDDQRGRQGTRDPRRECRPRAGATYLAHGTICKGQTGHFGKEDANMRKNSSKETAPADEKDRQTYRELFDEKMNGTWWTATWGLLPFAQLKAEGRRERAKRKQPASGAVDGDTDSQTEDEDQDAQNAQDAVGGIETVFSELGEVEETDDEDDLWSRAQTYAASREPDGINTIDDLHRLSPGLKELHDHDPDWANNLLEGVEYLMKVAKVSKACAREVTRILTKRESKGIPGFTLDSLMRKYKAEYEQMYSCPFGHDKQSEVGSECRTCGAKRTVRSLSMNLETVFKHLLRDPEVSEHIHDGLIHQAEFLEKMDAALAEHADGGGGGGGTDRPLIHPLMDCNIFSNMNSVWESPAAYERMRKLGWIRPSSVFKAGGPKSTPLLYQLFIDAVQPFEGGHSIIVGMVRLLNLPPHLANRHIQVAFVVDGTAKPKHIDAVLEPYMNDTVAHAPREGDPEPAPVWTADLGNSDRTIQIVPVLFDFPMDSRSMNLICHHREAPAECPCNKCQLKSRQINNPVTQAKQSVYDHVDGAGRQWTPKDDAWARDEMNQAARIANEHPDAVPYLKGYYGKPVWERVWYLDAVWDLPECAMHQIANVARRLMTQLTEHEGWKSDAIGYYVRDTDEGREWAQKTGYGDESFANLLPAPVGPGQRKKPCPAANLAPCKAKPAPSVRAVVKPGDRHLKQSYRALDNTRPPSNFHGKPADILYWTLTPGSKEDKHHKDIKASAHLDNMRSGILGIAAMYSGCSTRLAVAIADLGQAIKQLTSRVVDREEILGLYRGKMEAIVGELFRLQPESERTPAMHKLLHLPYQVLLKGPLPDLWSFAFESMFAQLKPLILKNKAMPAQTLMDRLATHMALRDCLRILKPAQPADTERIAVASPVSRNSVEQMALKQDLRTLLRSMADESTAAADDTHYAEMLSFEATEYKKLTIHGSMEIQGAHSRRHKTDNGHLCLNSGTNIPALGRVQAIYVISMHAPDPAAKPGQVYLLVDQHALCLGPEYHPEVYRSEGGTATRRLIKLDSIIDQCFLGADPDHPKREQNREDLVVRDPKGLSAYDKHLVYTKGSLRNQKLDPRAPVSGHTDSPSM
jgi:hypothetical protein